MPGQNKSAIYIRVSTDEQATTGTSPETQREKLRIWAKLKDFDIVQEYEDLGISGKIPLADRPAGKRLIQDAKNKKFSILLVYSIDRFGRSALEILKAVDLLKSLAVNLLSHNESFDSNTPSGQLSLTMLAAIAQYERSQILGRTLDGRERRVRNKKLIGGPIPFGYDIDTEGHLIPSTRIVLGITEAEVAKTLFVNIANGSTLVAECQRLNQAGVPCVSRYRKAIVNRNTPWLVSRLSAMLSNEIYIGKYTFKSKRGYITYDVPAIVDHNLWNAVRYQLGRNKHRRESKQRLNLLKGLIRCNLCHSSMSAVPAYTGSHGKPKHYHRHIYRCNAGVTAYRPDRARCPAKQVPADEIEAWVWAGLAEILHDPEQALTQAREQLEQRRTENKDIPKQQQELNNALYENQQKRLRIVAWYRDKRLSEEEAEDQYDIIAKERSAIEAKLHQLEFQESLNAAIEDQYKEAGQILKEHYDLVETANHDIQVRYLLIQKFVRRVLIDTYGAGHHKTYSATAEYVLGGSKYLGRPGEVIPVKDFNIL